MNGIDKYTVDVQLKATYDEDSYKDTVVLGEPERYTWMVHVEKDLVPEMLAKNFLAEEWFRIWQAIGYEVFFKLKSEQLRTQRDPYGMGSKKES